MVSNEPAGSGMTDSRPTWRSLVTCSAQGTIPPASVPGQRMIGRFAHWIDDETGVRSRQQLDRVEEMFSPQVWHIGRGGASLDSGD